METFSPLKVLVAQRESEKALRFEEFLHKLLAGRNGEMLAIARSMEEVLKRGSDATLIVCQLGGLDCEGGSALEAIRQLRQPVLVMSDLEDPELMLAAGEAGASGYLIRSLCDEAHVANEMYRCVGSWRAQMREQMGRRRIRSWAASELERL
jgi:DNA-binding NarL/FixJ family response regulator